VARTAIVTGGVTGIGAATCRTLKKAGYQVAATYFGNHADAEKFRDETRIPAYESNVADFDACQRDVKEIAKAIVPIDILINNAGITRDATLHKMTHERWRSVIDVDLSGCLNMCRTVVEGMRERRFGRIVNISSINALAGQFGQTNYAAAKAGIIGFTKGARPRRCRARHHGQ
jgi:acetoacetyl-CoA reductase